MSKQTCCEIQPDEMRVLILARALDNYRNLEHFILHDVQYLFREIYKLEAKLKLYGK